jgi:Tfp pilus assembly protein PilP
MLLLMRQLSNLLKKQAENLMQEKRKNKKLTAEFIILAGSLVVLLLSSSGCKEDKAPASSAVQPSNKAAAGKSSEKQDLDKTQGDAEQKRDYFYNPNGKVDPFTPLITSAPSIEQATPESNQKKDIPLSPLQKLAIEDFKLAAIITSDKKFTALLEDPAINGFIVTEGMLIGRDGGVIKKILSNSIIIEEEIKNDQGNMEMKIRTLTLKKK